MVERRSKGRPANGSDEKGKEKLLEAAVQCLRAQTQVEVTRQDIARFAGVTPALVTYYFQSKSDLILAATQPILREAIENVIVVLRSDRSYRDRLKVMISMFIDFAAQNCRVLDAFVQASLQSDNKEGQDLVLSTFGEMQEFFRRGAEAGEWRDFEPTFFIVALWGMCKFVGEPPAFSIPMLSLDVADEPLRNMQAEFIVELLTRGISA